MNSVFASGVSAYQGAAQSLNRAAARINTPVQTSPSTSLAGADRPDASAATPTAPIPRGGRVFSSGSISEAMIDIVKASHSARAAATSIRAADDMIGELLDVKA